MQSLDPTPEPVPSLPSTRKGSTLLIWLLILLVVTGIVIIQAQRGEVRNEAQEADAALTNQVLDIQGKTMLGAATITDDRKAVLAQLAKWQHGTLPEQIRYVVFVAELETPDAALQEIKRIKREQKKVPKSLAILQKLNSDVKADKPALPSLTPEDREELKKELGWHGKLALHPPPTPDVPTRKALLDEAKTTTGILLGGGLGGLCVCGMGLIGLIVLFVMLGSGSITFRLNPTPSRGAIYAETFLIWLVLFWGGQMLLMLPGVAKIPVPRMILVASIFCLSLVSLGWPVYRGVSWSQVRQEVGLHGGKNPFIEVLTGFATWAMALPILAIGALLTLLLMWIFSMISGGGPVSPNSHPVFENLVSSNTAELLQILLVASVMAPIVEETMFRGVLHRHLRELTSHWRMFWSFLFSAMVNGIIFAIVHPQGIMGVPVLTSLAVAFTLAREWRGSLIPCMVAHGIHNGLVIVVVSALIG